MTVREMIDEARKVYVVTIVGSYAEITKSEAFRQLKCADGRFAVSMHDGDMAVLHSAKTIADTNVF